MASLALFGLLGGCASVEQGGGGPVEAGSRLEVRSDQEPVPAVEQDPAPETAAPVEPGEPGESTDDPVEILGEPNYFDPEQTAPEETGPPDASIHGTITARTRSRWDNDGNDDHNVYGVADVELKTAGVNPWTVRVMARGQWQIGGPSDDPVFFGIEDTYSSAVTGRLYYAYADTPLTGALGLARIGRQQMIETPTVAFFDGARLETKEIGRSGFAVGVYGGFPVRLFRSEYVDTLMGGLWSTLRPWKGGQLRFDYMHLVDDPRFAQDQNDLVSFGIRHQFNQNLRVNGDYSLLEGESRDAHVNAFWGLPEHRFTIRYSFYNLFEPQTDLVNELNPYYNALGTWFPFYQNKLALSKGFGDWFELLGGLDFRRVEDENDISKRNRDFERYFLTFSFVDVLPLHTTFNLTGEYWDSPDNDIGTWGLDIRSQFSKSTRGSIGTFYSLYKYYTDSDEESVNVRTYYAEVRHRINEPTDFMARYEYEDDESLNYNTLRLGVKWTF